MSDLVQSSLDILGDAARRAAAFERIWKSGQLDVTSADFLVLGPTMQQALVQKLSLPLQPLSGRGGWWNVIHEPYTGAWQRNTEIRADNVLAYSAVFACVTLIASDIGKLTLRLVEQDRDGIWTETDSPAFSPVLRRPNRYQTINKFVEQWIVSKLLHGNTYILKQYDGRDIVKAMYVLDPTRVTPLVAEDGAVYYELRRDDLSELKEERDVVPASYIIHDTMVALFHPLIGVTPLYASGHAALQGLAIQANSQAFFEGGSNPSGILTAPNVISDEVAAAMQLRWSQRFGPGGTHAGQIAVLGNGLSYVPMTMKASDAQLIEQLKWTAETVCSVYHVPPYLVDIGPPPPYANFEPLLLKYHSQCIQSLTTHFEKHLEHGLGIDVRVDGRQYGVEFDIDDLIWMDTATRGEAAKTATSSGNLAPNESRKKYYGVGPVKGGELPFLQQQNFSLAALERLGQGTEAVTMPQPVQVPPPETEDADMLEERMMAAFVTKALEAGFYA